MGCPGLSLDPLVFSVFPNLATNQTTTVVHRRRFSRLEQVEAMRFCINAPTEVLDEEEEEPVLCVSDSEAEEDSDQVINI
jgi:hypothetical protein